MELSSPIGNLDNHICPKCSWSFIDRIPRTLDCSHSFYFCEGCLKKQRKIRCTACRKITIIKQILSPRHISNKSVNTSSLDFSFSSQNDEIDNELDENSKISQFATLLTQIDLSTKHTQTNNNPTHQIQSAHQLFTSPLKHYKHHNKYGPSSEPLKHSNHNQKMQFEYEQIINIEKEINSLTDELTSDKFNSPNGNKTIAMKKEINFMKQQIVELLTDNNKLNKKCENMSEEITRLNEENRNLKQQSIQQQQNVNELENKYQILRENMITKQHLNKLKLKCSTLSSDVKNYRNNLIQNTFKPFMDFVNEEMRKMVKMSKQVLFEYNKEVLLRRKHFNEIQDLKGSIRVFCRIRPLLDKEITNNYKMNVDSIDDFKVHIEKNKANDREKDYKKTFEFDRVYSIRSTQDEVFNDTKELITSVLDGYNVTIFAYGQTGSGKTYTMEGINYRTITELFNVIKQRELNYKYTMKLNMVEIYNENIKDLLVISNVNASEKDLKRKSLPTYLKIRGNDKTGIRVNNLSELNCQSIDDVYKALDIGYKNRSNGVTDMNEHSSRSHCILTVNVEGIHFKSNNKYCAKLNLIDLAGSERVKNSNASGNTMKEAQCINKSLSCLGNVLESIRLKRQHIPYRDSKLTHLLKDSIGNSAKTLMFVNVSSCSKDVDQTLTSLLFANRIRNVCLGKSIKSQSKIYEPRKNRALSSSAIY